jgi:hypothetical protein
MALSNDCKLQLKRTGKNIVFEETDDRLESAASFSQYIIRCNVLVTLIGERHDRTFDCDAPSLSISEYCVRSVKRNPKCRIILEYYCGNEKVRPDVPERMNSESIKTTFREMKKAGKQNQIIPLDYRPAFLTREGQDDLYGDGWSNYKSHDKIIEDFIVPFKKGVDKFAMNNPHFYSPKVIDFLKTYYDEMCTEFNCIEEKLSKSHNLTDIRQKLFDAWKLVADYFIIRRVLKKEDVLGVDEYIMILGEAHRVNIQNVFKKLNPLVSQIGDTQNGEKGDCVRLFQSYHF